MQIDISPFTADRIIGVVVGIAAFLGLRAVKTQDKQNAAYDHHIKECAEKAVLHERLEGKVIAINDRVCRIEKTTHTIDEKLNTLIERK